MLTFVGQMKYIVTACFQKIAIIMLFIHCVGAVHVNVFDCRGTQLCLNKAVFVIINHYERLSILQHWYN